MKVLTYEGYVENGCVHLPPDAVLPDKTRVYVVVPEVIEVAIPPLPRIRSPRLVHPEQAADFVKEVFEITVEKADA